MSIPTVSSDFWTARTDAIIANLREDEMLAERLDGETVHIYKGFPRLGTDAFAVFVYRAGRPRAGQLTSAKQDEDEYSLSGGIITLKASWHIVCVTRHAGDPGRLDDYISILSANVHRSLWRNRGPAVDGAGNTLWSVAITRVSDAATVRDEEDQHYEVETIPLQLVFQLRVG